MKKKVQVALRNDQTGTAGGRIPKVKDRLVSQLESRKWRTEVEKMVLVTKGHILVLGGALKGMKDAKNELWLANGMPGFEQLTYQTSLWQNKRCLIL